MKTKPSKKFRDHGDDGFEYKARGRKAYKHRQERSASGFDPVFKDCVFFKPKDGLNRLRPLPPSWDSAEHWGLDIWWHQNIGPDKQRYLCAEKHGVGKCAVCRERLQMPEQDAYEARAILRVATWFIDRDDEDAGPKMWAVPHQTDKEFLDLAEDKETKELYQIDHPEKGFDILFKKTGKERNTKYLSIQLSRKSTPLTSSPKRMARWLAYVKKHPLPDMLVFHDAEKISAALNGAGGGGEPEGDDLDVETRASREPKPKKKSKKTAKRSSGDVEDMDRPRGKKARHEEE